MKIGLINQLWAKICLMPWRDKGSSCNIPLMRSRESVHDTSHVSLRSSGNLQPYLD